MPALDTTVIAHVQWSLHSISGERGVKVSFTVKYNYRPNLLTWALQSMNSSCFQHTLPPYRSPSQVHTLPGLPFSEP